MSKVLLYVLNTIYAILGVILLGEGIGYFLYIYMFTSMRNSNHYLLDYTLHWTQILPWIFCFVGVFIIFVSCCGWYSVFKRNQGFAVMQASFTILSIIASITAAVLAVVYTDTPETVNFLKDALYDAFSELITNPGVSASFARIEEWLQCCGVDNPTDYKRIMRCFPKSCCGSGFDPSRDCDYSYTSKVANERYGCASVAASYSSVALKVLTASAALTAFFGVLSLIASLSLQLRKIRPEHNSRGREMIPIVEMPIES